MACIRARPGLKNMKTKAECIGCKQHYMPTKPGAKHLLRCPEVRKIFRPEGADTEFGYLLRVSCHYWPRVYWMFVAVPNNLKFKDLDMFLRNTWLECCGHLSQFKIGPKRPPPVNFFEMFRDFNDDEEDMVMKEKLNQYLSEGLTFEYVYDMGSSTELKLHVMETIEACPKGKVTLLMKNEAPSFVCEACQISADTLCSFCCKTTCTNCKARHECVVKEKDDYMMRPLVNSPRAGECGYE